MTLDDAKRIAGQMAHHVPDVEATDLVIDIYNEKWHHVAATIARAVCPKFLAGQRVSRSGHVRKRQTRGS